MARDDPWKERTKDNSAQDGLVPLQTLDPAAIGDFDDMLRAMGLTAMGGRRLGEAAEVLTEMICDPDCAVILTLSGAMTVAKMNLVITEMVERGWVQALVSTGALMTHGLVELAGMTHYKARDDLDDAELFERGYNRVYDTYELEANLNDLGLALEHEVLPRIFANPFGSHELLSAIGQWLAHRGRGIVSTCHLRGVPIYIPAFTDCEMGLDVASFLIKRRAQRGEHLRDILSDLRSPFDPFRDLAHYADLVLQSPKLGIVTIGGGVPRNWAQQVSPFIDYMGSALDLDLPNNRFAYGVRICPEPAHWGGLSGCTYSEGVSWGKFVPPSEGGRYAEVHADATLVWPMLVKGVAQRLQKEGLEAKAPQLELRGLGPRE